MTMDRGKDLPPLTLNNTTVSCLVTLIPVLVSMTSHGDMPCYEDESDKPVWWPSDIQWRNPKFYVQNPDRKGDGLNVLRKLVYSCYSYHGMEDLLCRLEETPRSNNETEQELCHLQARENLEILQLEEVKDEYLEESSKDGEGPVFVCCFCLDQFNSHERVSMHQRICSMRLKGDFESHKAILTNQTKIDSRDKYISMKACFNSSQEPAECPAHSRENTAHFPKFVMASNPGMSASDKLSTKASVINFGKTQNYSALNEQPCDSYAAISASTVPLLQTPETYQSQTSNSQTSAVTASYKCASFKPFVPTLKTRSQKKLDQVIKKKNLRRLMLQECHQMKKLPRTGAWWVKLKRRKLSLAIQYPSLSLSKNTFISLLGLSHIAHIAAITAKDIKIDQDMDLDCEIVSVEGPLNAICTSAAEKSSSISPRPTRSLMSQLTRDSGVTCRRRLSFCFVDDEWADREALNEGRDPLQFSLLALEISSPLGQRVKKYVRGESNMNVIKDVENYCKTEVDNDGCSKLRFRASDFRITFRKKRRASHYVHKYKFNKIHKLEFEKLLKTGLNTKCRLLKQSLPICKVILRRLTKSEIKFWTEEKKLTLSEKIIFDDDVCITQIDIPESMTTPSFAPDSSSPPHNLYLHTQRSGLSSPLSIGRQSAESRLLSARISASPPHIPNIFRSRTTYTSSSPCPGIASGQPDHPSRKGSELAGRINQNIAECSKFNFLPSKWNGPQDKMSKRSSQNVAHLSGHACLSPSPYTVINRSAFGQKYNKEVVINRRKQQLTHVRKEDSDDDRSCKSTASSNRRLPSEGNGKTNIHGQAILENRHGNTMQKQEFLTSVSAHQLLHSSTRRLSNFDYFSIRDSGIQPLYGHQNHGLVKQHKASASSLSISHPINHISERYIEKISYRSNPLMKNVSCSSELTSKSYDHSSTNIIQPSFYQGGSNAKNECKPHLHYSSRQNSDKLEKTFSVNHSVHKAQSLKDMELVVPSLMDHLLNTSSFNSVSHDKVSKSQHIMKNTLYEDDDVMEIICIDDD